MTKSHPNFFVVYQCLATKSSSSPRGMGLLGLGPFGVAIIVYYHVIGPICCYCCCCRCVALIRAHSKFTKKKVDRDWPAMAIVGQLSIYN